MRYLIQASKYVQLTKIKINCSKMRSY